jgi:uncharacterized membrane protein HdeD (DUF308 family)
VNGSRWLRIFQIAIGSAAIILSILVMVLPRLGSLTAIVIFAVVFFIVGVERIASGIGSRYLSRRSKMISIGLGIVILAFAVITLASPVSSVKFLVLMVGLALLFNGIVRIIDGIRKSAQYGKGQKMFRIFTGAICIAFSGFVLSSEQIGIIIVTIVMSVALIIQGIQLVVSGIKGEESQLLGKKLR